MNHKKLAALFILGAVIAAAFGVASASAAEYKTKLTLVVSKAGPKYDEGYILKIPADLTIANSGWNTVGNITVSRSADMSTSFDVSKKVVVAIASQNGAGSSAYLLQSEDKTTQIAYTFATSSDQTGTSTLSLSFSASEVEASGGTSKSFGVFVEDYSTKAAGTYEDYVTYTAKVEDVVTLADALTDGAVTVVTVSFGSGNTVTATLIYNSSTSTFTASSSSSSYTVSATYQDNKITVSIPLDDSFSYDVNLFPANNTYYTTNGAILNSITVKGENITTTLSYDA